MQTAFPTLAIEESASVPVSMSSVPNSERTVKSKFQLNAHLYLKSNNYYSNT